MSSVLALLASPWLVAAYRVQAGLPTRDVPLLEGFLYLTALPFIVLLVMAGRLYRYVVRESPFCAGSIKALHIIGICAFADGVLYAAGTIFFLQRFSRPTKRKRSGSPDWKRFA